MKSLANNGGAKLPDLADQTKLIGTGLIKTGTRWARYSAIAMTIIVAAGCSTVALGPTGGNDQSATRGPVVDRRDIAHIPDQMPAADGVTTPVVRPTLARTPEAGAVNASPPQPDNVAGLLRSMGPDAYPPEPDDASISGYITAQEPEPPGDLWQRIRDGFAMPELPTKLVQQKEQMYLKRPDYMNRMMARGSRYLYHIVEEIERRGMPTEIALLPFVESAMNPVAMSHAKAAGLWQFIPSTGRAYDLKQNWWVDNRRDVVQSTRAALDYLEMLHEMHNGDWFLALASYNWGEGSVGKAIARNKRQGKPTDYLSLRMPRETRHYVPKLIALKNIIENADSLGVALPELLDQPYFVVIEKTRPIDLELAAKFAGLSVAEFVALNPAHNRPVISASRNNQIKIPAANLESFLTAIEKHEASGQSFATWRPYTLRKNESLAQVAKRAGLSTEDLLKANGLSSKRHLIAGTRILVPDTRGAKDEQIAAFAAPTIVEIVNLPARYHRVRRNESLSRIGKRWGVSTKTLRAWNGLKSNTIRSGQRLLVRQPTRQTVQTAANGGTKVLAAARTKTLVHVSSKTHTVKRGETLSGIAQRYNVSINALRKWNSVSRDRIRIGQRLSVAPAKTITRTAASSGGSDAAIHKVRRGETLGRIASRYNVSLASLRQWNQLKGSRILVGQRLRVGDKPATKVASVTTESSAVHKVRRGETLSGIAKRYRASVTDLKRWNGLRSSMVMIGQTLKVAPVPAGKRSKKIAAADTSIQPASSLRTVSHKVARGDTLSGIASRYGVSIKDLKRWNSIRGSKIQLGDKLDVKVRASTLTRNKRSGKIT